MTYLMNYVTQLLEDSVRGIEKLQSKANKAMMAQVTLGQTTEREPRSLRAPSFLSASRRRTAKSCGRGSLIGN